MTWENLNERNTTSKLSVVAIDHRIDLFVRGSDGSLRWTMGDDSGFRWHLLYVVYVENDDVIRIISARLANKAERVAYENQ